MELTRLPKPTMVWNPSRFCTNERIGNLSCAITKLKSHVLSLVKTTVGFGIGLLSRISESLIKVGYPSRFKSFLSDFLQVDFSDFIRFFSDF